MEIFFIKQHLSMDATMEKKQNRLLENKIVVVLDVYIPLVSDMQGARKST